MLFEGYKTTVAYYINGERSYDKTEIPSERTFAPNWINDKPTIVTEQPIQSFTEQQDILNEVQPSEVTPSLPEFVVRQEIAREVYRDKILITGIPATDYGRVMGRHGANAMRLENEFGVCLSFKKKATSNNLSR
jgi:hypothetical protein